MKVEKNQQKDRGNKGPEESIALTTLNRFFDENTRRTQENFFVFVDFLRVIAERFQSFRRSFVDFERRVNSEMIGVMQTLRIVRNTFQRWIRFDALDVI